MQFWLKSELDNYEGVGWIFGDANSMSFCEVGGVDCSFLGQICMGLGGYGAKSVRGGKGMGFGWWWRAFSWFGCM